MVFGVLSKGVVFSLGFLLFVAKAQDEYVYPEPNNFLYNKLEVEPVIIISSDTLQCYDCNSEYDPRCGDPFNPYTIGIINCTDRNTPEHLVDPLDPDIKLKPTLCRKIVQTVEGRVRVIRGCGYIRDFHDDRKCFRRTGTKNVEVFHCSCTNSLCNVGYSVLHSTTIFNKLFIVLSSFIIMSSRLSFLN